MTEHENRHACEVRNLADRYRKAEQEYGTERAKRAMSKFLAEVENHRGKAARGRLEQDALEVLNQNTPIRTLNQNRT